MSNLTRNTITSMEVAEMVGKEHSKLLRDIRNYVSQLAETVLRLSFPMRRATYGKSRCHGPRTENISSKYLQKTRPAISRISAK